jgi:hypothetical protein
MRCLCPAAHRTELDDEDEDDGSQPGSAESVPGRGSSAGRNRAERYC